MFLSFLVMFATASMMAFATPAYAQNIPTPFPGHSQIPTTSPSGATAASSIKRTGTNITIVPKLAALIAYAIGTFLTIIGLWKMRLWMIDSDRNTLNAALFRMIVGALLIALPHIFIIVNNALFGTDASSGIQQRVPVPKLFAYDR